MSDEARTQVSEDVELVLRATDSDTVTDSRMEIPAERRPQILFDGDTESAEVHPSGHIVNGDGDVIAQLDPEIDWTMLGGDDE
mgnify:CR=1 FL=1